MSGLQIMVEKRPCVDYTETALSDFFFSFGTHTLSQHSVTPMCAELVVERRGPGFQFRVFAWVALPCFLFIFIGEASSWPSLPCVLALGTARVGALLLHGDVKRSDKLS